MRLALLLVVVLSFVPTLLPSAAAEDWRLMGAGASMGMRAGLTGVIWDDDGGVIVRYWQNATQEGSAAVQVTACLTPNNHFFAYCQATLVAV